jgi:uncharacterized membrane protein required for colicin V production
MTHLAVLPPVLAHARFNYFDMIAIVWLIIGLFWGRMKGMTLEWLALLQWIGIVTAGGLLYPSFSHVIHRYTYYSASWSDITAYVLIAVGVHLLYIRFREAWFQKLGGKKLFGRADSSLGMVAGGARFACMLLAGLALMNSRVATAAEPAKTDKSSKNKANGIYILKYGEFQRNVLIHSLAGNWVQTNLKSILIASWDPLPTPPPPPQAGTLAHKASATNDNLVSRVAKK